MGRELTALALARRADPVAINGNALLLVFGATAWPEKAGASRDRGTILGLQAVYNLKCVYKGFIQKCELCIEGLVI